MAPSHCRALVAAATLALAGCVDFTGLDELSSSLGGDGTIREVSVAGPSTVAVGDTIRLSASGIPNGLMGMFMYDRMLDAVWASSNPAVATVALRLPPHGDSTTSTGAMVRGVRVGTVQVTASARGSTGAVTIQVVAPPPPPP